MKAPTEIMSLRQVLILSVPCMAQVQMPVLTTRQISFAHPQAVITFVPRTLLTSSLTFSPPKRAGSTMQSWAVEEMAWWGGDSDNKVPSSCSRKLNACWNVATRLHLRDLPSYYVSRACYRFHSVIVLAYNYLHELSLRTSRFRSNTCHQ